ncbi:anti-CBASS protein Acb1 family protein [Burkholderia sp. ISTR5]|uniref:anti-CBASS protein Acb1 family protein n=1 Tax=Burkholderia sp. ISTR5 TaxID=2500161 RepID=UPI001F259A91|nr:anti-CBASS Acb1 family protein [Burkholderia sp. ISTR5]
MGGYYGDGEEGSQAMLGVGTAMSPELMRLLAADDLQPGSPPSYEMCKTIYSYHPLGAKMAEAPYEEALSQDREITIPGAPEDDLVEAFRREWAKLGTVGADEIIKNFMTLKRVYGIASLIVGARELPTNEPLPLDRLHELDLYFNILDPLNTAGSLVLNQNPNASDFQKPQYLRVANHDYHPSRAVIALNEAPIYIEWTNSAFGFVGRSVYQRALYPLKSYVQSMITDNQIIEKSGLLVYKMKSPGAVIDKVALAWGNLKRRMLKGAKTGNVMSIGLDESIESIDLKNIRDAAEFARTNVIKNIATAAKMPAVMIAQDTLTEGFGEGTEDAKMIARFIDRIRIEMGPAYEFLDPIVMRRAWSPEFYASMQRKYPDYAGVPYATAFVQWKNAFTATWPNLLVEPDSERIKTDDVITKAAIACVEVMLPELDPENKATAIAWLAEVMNERKLMFSSPLEIEIEALKNYEPPAPPEEPRPEVESSHE